MSMTRISTGDDTLISSRITAWDDALRLWGKEFADFSASFMPAGPPPEGAKNNASWNWGVKTDSGVMANAGDLETETNWVEQGRTSHTFWTSIALLGAKIDPDQYSTAMLKGQMGVTLAEKMRDVMSGIERRKAYDRIKFMMGDTNIVERFTNMPITNDRYKAWDVTSSTDMGTGKGGGWDTVATDILWQLDYIEAQGGALLREPLRTLVIPPTTYFYINQNTNISDKIQYNVDLRGKMFDSEIRGLQIKRVAGDTYKDASSGTGAMDSPGLGNLTYSTWDAITESYMLRESHGGSTYDTGLLMADTIGKTWEPDVYSAEGYPTGNLVTFEYEEYNPYRRFAYVITRYGLAVEDWAKCQKLQKLCVSFY